jgi:hypothetical protein
MTERPLDSQGDATSDGDQQNEHSGNVNTSGGAFIGGSVNVGRDFIGRDKIENYFNTPLPDPEQQAVMEILSACYRRAVFTRTPLEMDQEAMFGSLITCRNLVMPQIPKIKTRHLQQVASDIIAVLDEIELRRRYFRNYTWTEWRVVQEIDDLKLHMLNLLSELAEGSGQSYVLPRALSDDRYFTLKEANSRPDGRRF